MAGSTGVDVETAAAGVTGIHREFDGLAVLPDIHKNALDALFMKLVMVSKAHDVLQQTFLINL